MNLFGNQGFSAEKFQFTPGAKHECVCIGEGERNSVTLPESALQGGITQGGENFLRHDLSVGWK